MLGSNLAMQPHLSKTRNMKVMGVHICYISMYICINVYVTIHMYVDSICILLSKPFF